MNTPITVLNTKINVDPVNLTYGKDNTLELIKALPIQAVKTFVLTGANDRMGLTAAGAVGYLIVKDSYAYAAIIAVTPLGIKTRIFEGGILLNWV